MDDWPRREIQEQILSDLRTPHLEFLSPHIAFKLMLSPCMPILTSFGRALDTHSEAIGSFCGAYHGIQIQNGPHKGRLAFAERFDCPGVDESAPYWRSYVLYSDDEGRTWTTGQLLPEGWTGKSKRPIRPFFTLDWPVKLT